MVCVSGAAMAADVLPPDVRTLGAKVDEAQVKLGVVRGQMVAAQRKFAVMDTRLRRATNTLVRTQQYPPGFWWARAVIGQQPVAADVASMAVRQGVADVTAVDARVKDLRTLYGEANAQIDELRGLQAAFATARGKLSGAQKDALRAAMVQADELAAKMSGVQVVPEAVESLVAIPEPTAVVEEVAGNVPRLPVEGQVVQGFKKGKGATAEGVVLHGTAGSEVKSMAAGEVLYSGPFRQFGGLVIVKSESGEDILYGGMASLHVTTGGHVLAGDVLGTLADDGRLYWEVRRRGRTVNPLALR